MALAERFGWTWDELMEQDMSQVLPAVAAANIHAAVQRVYQWQDAAGRGANVPLPSDDDLRTLKFVTDAQREPHA